MRDGGIARIVLVQRRAAARLAQQVESGEMGQVETVVEDQRRLDAAVGQEQPAVKLRQMGSILRHGPSSGLRAACRHTTRRARRGLYPRTSRRECDFPPCAWRKQRRRSEVNAQRGLGSVAVGPFAISHLPLKTPHISCRQAYGRRCRRHRVTVSAPPPSAAASLPRARDAALQACARSGMRP